MSLVSSHFSPPLAAPPELSDRSLDNASPPLDGIRAPPEGAESNGNADARGKKPAWKRPSGVSIEPGPVMGAVSWPALSEATRAAPKSSSSPSLKPLSDGSVAASPVQVHAIASPPLNNPNPIANPNPNPIPNPIANPIPNPIPNPIANPIPNPTPPIAGPKPVRHGGGGSGTRPLPNSTPLQSSPLPASPEVPVAAPISHPTPKDHSNKSGGNWEGGFAPQPHGGYTNRGYGGSGKGAGGLVNRRDHEKGSYEWNQPPRGYGGRGLYGPQLPQHRGHPRSFIRPPPIVSAPSPFMPMRAFSNPMGFPDLLPHVYYFPTHPSPESFAGMPFVPHPVAHAMPPAMMVPALDHQRAQLLKQIEYYFSPENLCRDMYLRQNMDENGWVPISLIAGFNRVKQWTQDVHYILDTVRSSTILEVQGEKIRRRNDWMKWILLPPPSQHNNTNPAPRYFETTAYDKMVAGMQRIGLEGNSST